MWVTDQAGGKNITQWLNLAPEYLLAIALGTPLGCEVWPSDDRATH